jgi:site-specific DNA recombinase
MERPALKELIADVKAKKCGCVLVWKLDRLSRSQKDTLILLEDVFVENGCDFVSIMESFDTSSPFGRCVVGILASFAQMERENIKARTTMGRVAKIRKGYFSGSHCPIGYKFKEGCNELLVDTYHSVIIKEVYQLFLEGAGLTAIGKIIVRKYGDTSYDWSHNTAVRRVLSNPVYMGKVRIKDELYPGIHEALVSEEDWYKVAALLDHNRAISKRSYSYKIDGAGRSDNLLSGLLFCGDCGARMYARKVSSKTKKYICHSVARTSPAMIKSDSCSNRLHPYTVADLDEIVIHEIEELSLDRSKFDSMIADHVNTNVSELPILQERINELQKQENRLLNLYQSGIVDLNDISGRLGALKEEKEKLRQSISALEAIEVESTAKDAWEQVKDFSAVLGSADPESLQRLIHSLIDRIDVLNEDITIYWSFC